jgi:N-acylneuraminate cytidylyltransferase
MRVAVIPARGGSKRIPRKNIKLFAGKPIIAYSIEAASGCGLFDRIVVSTEDKEIASVSRGFGAETPFIRPAELADDSTGTNAVVKHALRWLLQEKDRIEFACCIYATAPFLSAKILKEGYDRLVKSKYQYAFAVTSFPFPIQRALRIARDGAVSAMWPENILRRSQDLEAAFHDAGQFYWGRTRAFLEDIVVFSGASLPIMLPRHLVQDLDTLEDWDRAELMYRAYVKK